MLADDELKECSFEPLTYESLRNPDAETRDLYGFLSDQQRFLEERNQKLIRTKQETLDKEESEITNRPNLDELS